MRHLGIDYGAKRVGIALSDEGGTIAFPHATFSNDGTLLEEVKRVCHEYDIKRVVIGDSRQLNGEPNDINTAIERFVPKIEAIGGISVFREPEFFTSRQAARLQGETGMLDASAAALILQSYLDRENGKQKAINIKQ